VIALHQFEISPYCDKIRRVLYVKRKPCAIAGVPLAGVLSRQGIGRKPKAAVLADVERHVAALAGLLRDGDWLV